MPAEPTKAKLKRRASRKELEEYRFDGSHGRELEMKRNRGEVSCAECRRLKIKCDKQIPCQSCQRRGCATLCPNGSLATGQGTRFVLAATEHLHRRIARLSGRIRQLEDALAVIHAKHSTEPHPLLHEDLIAAEEQDGTEDTGEEGFGPPAQNRDALDAFGTLSISDHGISRFFGPTGGSESLLLTNMDSNQPSPESTHTPDSLRGSKSPSSSDLSLFSQSFPFTPMGPTADVQALIESHLPPYEHTVALCETYFDQCAWLFRGTTRTQLMDDMVPVIYKQQAAPPGEDYSGPHELALLFIVLAIGSLVLREPSDSQGEHFHQISRAALALQPVLEKPSIVTIQCLHLMSIYSAMSGSDMKNETSMEMAWSLITLSCHLSQTIGLHRDSARWGLSPKMVQRRRTLFWDLFTADVWQSLNNGRPPSFSLAYIDCCFPQYENDANGKDTTLGATFEIWQFRFASECVADVTARTLTAEAPSYATIMDLDRKVREFALPEGLGSSDDFGTSFQRFVLEHIKETVLMYIHRSFFAQAIIDHPANPLKSPYAPSFLAAYRASSTILKSVREQFKLWPNSCSRFWTMWTFAFSAAVVFGTVATRGPRSPLAQSAMSELEQACVLFSKAAATSLRATKALPILTRLSEKARYALAAAQKDPDPLSGDKGGLLWNIKQEDTDELSIIAGRTRFISTKKGDTSNSTPPHSVRFEPSPPLYPAAAPQPMQTQLSGPVPAVGSGYQVPSHPPPPPSSSSSMSSMSSTWEPQSRDEYMAPPMEMSYSYAPSQRTQPPPDTAAPYAWPNESRQHAAGPSSMQHRPAASSSSQQLQHSNAPPPPQQYQMQSAPVELQPPQGHYASQYPPPSHSRAHPQPHVPPQHQPSGYPQHHASSQHPSQHPSYSMYNPNPGYPATGAGPAGSNVDLADLGLVSRDSRLDERWGSFMADSGLLDDYRRR